MLIKNEALIALENVAYNMQKTVLVTRLTKCGLSAKLVVQTTSKVAFRPKLRSVKELRNIKMIKIGN